MRSYINGFQAAARIPALTVAVMSTCLVVYATIVVASNGHVGVDVGLLCTGMLVMRKLVAIEV